MGKIYEYVVHVSKISWYEKYIGQGLYEFVKEKRLKIGDEMDFTLHDPPEILYVSLHNC